MTARDVREDQHGTSTGYAYGCRCDECRSARREYAAAHDPTVSPTLLERVYQALEHDADMDGLVIASAVRLGELAGVSPPSAFNAVHQLAESGRIQMVGRSAGRGGAHVVQMSDS